MRLAGHLALAPSFLQRLQNRFSGGQTSIEGFTGIPQAKQTGDSGFCFRLAEYVVCGCSIARLFRAGFKCGAEARSVSGKIIDGPSSPAGHLGERSVRDMIQRSRTLLK